MKNTHVRGPKSDAAPVASPRRARVVVGVALVGALAVSAFDAAQEGSTVPQSDYVAPPPLARTELVRFAEVERAIEALQLDDGHLKIDADLEAALAQATTHQPPDAPITAAAMERYRFLIRKALPDPAGSAFANLFAIYAGYRRTAADLLNPQQPGTPASEAARLAQLKIARRAHFAPAVADALFGNEERLADYMIALQHLEQDATLTAPQKAAAAADLQRAYEAQSRPLGKEARVPRAQDAQERPLGKEARVPRAQDAQDAQERRAP